VSIASSLFNTLEAIFNMPGEILNLLSGSLATTSTYFICLIIAKMCVALPVMYLIRPLALCKAWCRGDWREAFNEPARFAVLWSKLLFGLSIGVCYSSIQPIATLFVLLYVAMMILVYKRGLIFSWKDSAESQGSSFPNASAMLMLILGTAQLLLAAVHASKQSWVTFGFILPLLFITWIAHTHQVRYLSLQLDTLALVEVPHIQPVIQSRSHSLNQRITEETTDEQGTEDSQADSQFVCEGSLTIYGDVAEDDAGGGGVSGGGRGGVGDRSPHASGGTQRALLMSPVGPSALEALFLSYYVQPELLHEQVVGLSAAEAHVAALNSCRASTISDQDAMPSSPPSDRSCFPSGRFRFPSAGSYPRSPARSPARSHHQASSQASSFSPACTQLSQSTAFSDPLASRYPSLGSVRTNLSQRSRVASHESPRPCLAPGPPARVRSYKARVAHVVPRGERGSQVERSHADPAAVESMTAGLVPRQTQSERFHRDL